MYDYYVVFEYTIKNFSFDVFSSSFNNIFGSAFINFNKPKNEFSMEDYDKIRDFLAKNLNKKNKREEINKDNIIIINIIQKKI